MKKILLIVDDPEMWEFMSFYLAMQGCKVYRSNRIEEMPETCQGIDPHLVVVHSSAVRAGDLEAFYHRMVASSCMENVKLLVLCDPVDYGKIKSAQRAQDAFITRPVRPKMLMIIVQDLIYNGKPEWIRFLEPRAA